MKRNKSAWIAQIHKTNHVLRVHAADVDLFSDMRGGYENESLLKED